MQGGGSLQDHVAYGPDGVCDSFIGGKEMGCGPHGWAVAQALGAASDWFHPPPPVALMQDNHGNCVQLGIFFMGIFVRNRIGRQAVIHR